MDFTVRITRSFRNMHHVSNSPGDVGFLKGETQKDNMQVQQESMKANGELGIIAKGIEYKYYCNCTGIK